MQLSNAIINFKYQNSLELNSIKIVLICRILKKNIISKNTNFVYLDYLSQLCNLTLTLDFLRKLKKFKELWKNIIKSSSKIKDR